jgi:hypothetical protein
MRYPAELITSKTRRQLDGVNGIFDQVLTAYQSNQATLQAQAQAATAQAQATATQAASAPRPVTGGSSIFSSLTTPLIVGAVALFFFLRRK